ncbi:MAG TPA: thymidine phosphorylase [Gaiellaceae bacterium]
MSRIVELIQRKRDGGELSAAEIDELIFGEVPDYQLAAFLMAVFFRGLSSSETFALTDAMVRSGDQIHLGKELGRRVVDKHSTGGVGDKATLAVGPVVAACGVPFGKMSGRGLGHTGGTLDKLESIPGFRVELSTEEFIAQVRDVGMAVVGQSADLVPADKTLYALRDVTATVDNVSLIAASIMSKKIASGADAIVLDVKVGDGAFMKSLADAQVLAEAMIALGRHAGLDVVCELTDMDQPLGEAVGNALEVREALATLKGEGSADLEELVVESCAHLLELSDLGVDLGEARRRARQAIADGSAVEAYDRWIRAQGGDPDESALPKAPAIAEAFAPGDGFVQRLSAIEIGLEALHLGAGRATKDQAIDHAVGIVCKKKRGDAVEEGEPLAEVHARDTHTASDAAERVRAAYVIGDEPPPVVPIVLQTLA